MRYLWLFLVSFVLACAPARCPESHAGVQYTQHPKEPQANTLIVPTWIDNKFPAELRHQTFEALAQWNLVLNGGMRFEVQVTDDAKKRQDRGEMILIIRSVSVDDTPFGGILGWWSGEEPAAINVVSDILNVKDMTPVIMHEIGHWFHLPHAEVKGTLMYPAYTKQGVCIDPVTVTLLAQELGWDARFMNWCVQ